MAISQITVVTSATDSKLTAVQTVKDEIGLSGTDDDNFIDRLIDEISGAITTYTDRVFAQEKVEERVPGYDHPDLIVSRTPIQSIESIEFVSNGSATTIDSDNYFISDAEAGFVRRDEAISGGIWSSTLRVSTDLVPHHPPLAPELSWKVTYTGGYVLPNWSDTRDLPHDIERACLEGVKARFLARQRDPNITRINIDNIYSASFTQFGLPETALQLLDPYRRIA